MRNFILYLLGIPVVGGFLVLVVVCAAFVSPVILVYHVYDRTLDSIDRVFKGARKKSKGARSLLLENAQAYDSVRRVDSSSNGVLK